MLFFVDLCLCILWLYVGLAATSAICFSSSFRSYPRRSVMVGWTLRIMTISPSISRLYALIGSYPLRSGKYDRSCPFTRCRAKKSFASQVLLPSSSGDRHDGPTSADYDRIEMLRNAYKPKTSRSVTGKRSASHRQKRQVTRTRHSGNHSLPPAKDPHDAA
jgi:hypothetical protein